MGGRGQDGRRRKKREIASLQRGKEDKGGGKFANGRSLKEEEGCGGFLERDRG